MPVAQELRKLCTLSTQKFYFAITVFPSGLPRPLYFFRKQWIVLLRIPNTHCYIDGMLITGRDDTDHLKTLDQVLTRLEKYGLKLQHEKLFFRQSLEYLGDYIDTAGLHKSPVKFKAIKEATAPTNISQLRYFLGIINYYGRFIPNLASVLNPLHTVLCKDKKWCWNTVKTHFRN